jgi:hypothetical protein
MAFGDKPFGLRDIKITSIGGTPTQADLPAAQTLTFRPRFTSGELMGDDSLVSVVAFVNAYEWQLSAGGISLEALAIMVGQTVVAAGTTPNQTKTLNIGAGDQMPYFKIYGKSVGENATDDIHVKLYKCKINSMEGQFQDGQFYITQASGIAIDDGTKGIIDIVQNETATDLPAT